jgi:hypothetical protein
MTNASSMGHWTQESTGWEATTLWLEELSSSRKELNLKMTDEKTSTAFSDLTDAPLSDGPSPHDSKKKGAISNSTDTPLSGAPTPSGIFEGKVG